MFTPNLQSALPNGSNVSASNASRSLGRCKCATGSRLDEQITPGMLMYSSVTISSFTVDLCSSPDLTRFSSVSAFKAPLSVSDLESAARFSAEQCLVLPPPQSATVGLEQLAYQSSLVELQTTLSGLVFLSVCLQGSLVGE